MPTPRLGAPQWTEGQALPETTGNEIVAYLEAATGHFIVKDRDLTAPPASPGQLDTYLVAAGATGAWSGHDGDLAVYVNTGWIFVEVIDGFVAVIVDELAFIAHVGGAWVPLGLTVDNDTTLASDSTVEPPSVHAVRGYVASAVTGLLDFKGNQDCSANPNYPAASKGDAYVVTVAGKIGGASGSDVAVGDWIIATADNAGGTQAAVGSSWSILEHNLTSVLSASFASASEIRTGTESAKVIAPDQLYAAAATVALTDGATITIDGNSGINFKVTLGGNRTLANPTNMKTGQSGVIIVTQDGTGSRTLSYGTNWKFPGGAASGGVLSTAAGATDMIAYYVRSDGTILATLTKAFS